MPLDANGIHQYVGSELAAPAPEMLNRLAGSTSTALGKTIKQTVQPFANAAERAALFPTPHPGAVVWLADIRTLEVWNGSRWARFSQIATGGPVNASTNAQGIVTFTHNLGVQPTWCVATMAQTGNDTLNLTMTPIVWALSLTTISIAIRREDSHQWAASQPVAMYVTFGAALGATLLPADEKDEDA
jgi:hypothetical protein